MSISNRIDKENIEDILNLTAMQKGILFHYLENIQAGNYYEQLSLSISGEVDENNFEEAWNFVVKSNEMLRVCFRWEKLNEPVQLILKKHKPEVNFYEVKGSKKDIKDLMDELKIKERQEKFNLIKVPFKLSLYKIEKDEFNSETDYIMVLSYHHIICDGWSMGIILKEFLNNYNKLCEGKIVDIVNKNKFKEYVKLELAQKDKDQEKYWDNYLKEFDEKNIIHGKSIIEQQEEGLRIDEEKEDTSDKYCFGLSEDLSQSVKNFCKENQITLASFLYYSWGLLLNRYCGSDDVVFGTTVSGRNVKIDGIEEMVGLFINTIPMRIKFNGNENKVNSLKNAHISLQDREEYELTPLINILIKREKNTRNLFDSVIVVENYPIDIIEKKDKLIENEKNNSINEYYKFIRINDYSMTEKTNFDLTVNIETNNNLYISILFDNKLYTNKIIEGMGNHFQNIIRELISLDKETINEIDILTNDEKNIILNKFNDTKVAYADNKTIHQVFEEQVERTPNSIAAIFNNKQLTYKELNERANHLAYKLRGNGVKRDSVVGVIMERSLSMIVGILGILKAGGAYLPIDPNCPEKRLKYIIDEVKLENILTQEKFELELAGLVNNSEILINVDELLKIAIEELSFKDNLENINSVRDLAYIIYTSGSTGEPKGVMIEHKSVINRLNWMQKKYSLCQDDIILQKTPFTFDVSVWELFWWSFYGAKVCFLTPGGEKNPELIVDAIEKEKISVMHFVPSMLAAFLDYIETNIDLSRLKSLKRVFVSGEELKPKHLSEFNEMLHEKIGTQLINLYGPTEATVDVTYYDCNNNSKNSIIPIGKPIDNIELFIIDKQNKLLPIGIPGELVIAGDGLARGYFNKPELTKERFIEARFTSNKRIYKTGDLARWALDGNIEFLGRIDNQVKIRGNRIELGEIENLLLEYEGVKNAIVTVYEKNGDKEICAYLLLADINKIVIDTKSLQEYLAEYLPSYMIPSYFIKLDNIPFTSSGKVNRKLLPVPDIKITNNHIEAVTEVEEKLVKIWAGLLNGIKENEISTDLSFFEIGGHSLKAINLISAIKKEFKVDLSIKDLFKYSTIQELAKLIEVSSYSNFHEIKKAAEKEYYPVSSAQKRFYILNTYMSENEKITYNIPGALVVEGSINKEYIKNSFIKLTKRHESLRTYFKKINNNPVQIISKDSKIDFEFRESNAENINEILDEFAPIFDLEVLPLFKVVLVKINNLALKQQLISDYSNNNDIHLLLIDMHHIISDGISINLLIKDFSEIYDGKELPPLELQYKDYAVWQNEIINKSNLTKQKDYWLDVFKNNPPVLDIPLDYARTAENKYEGKKGIFSIGGDLTKEIIEFSRNNEVTIFMTLISAYFILMSKYANQEDVVIGTPVAGRSHADLEKIVGVFINTLPLRSYPVGDKKFRTFLKEVEEHTLKAFENQDYQLENLIEQLNIDNKTRQEPLFNTIFSLQNVEDNHLELSNLKVKIFNFERNIIHYDLLVMAKEIKGGIQFIVEYSTKLFSEQTIKRMFKNYVGLIRQIVKSPEKQLCELSLLTDIEEKQLVLKYNNTYLSYPNTKTLHQLFEEQVIKTPQNIAVSFENRKMTYEELNQKSNELALVLRKKNVQPNDIVGIIMDRSIELVIGIMAILKASGAYLPIDPEYPDERKYLILKDSKTNMLLTDSNICSKSDKLKNYFSEENIITLENIEDYLGNSKNLLHVNSERDLAYVIYTSGSTGKPKGVMLEHRSVVNYITWAAKTYVGQKKTSFAMHTSIAFDLTITSLFTPLLTGNRIIIYKNNQLAKIVEDNEVDIIKLTPSHLKLLKEYDLSNTRIKQLIVGGENLETALASEITEKSNGEIIIHNEYGPTESTVGCMIYQYDTEKDKNLSVPIGKPIDNVQIYIMDKYLSPLPVGFPGELFISGDGLARGYLGKEELTEKIFIDHPFLPGKKMYRTGDLAKFIDEETIEFIGRVDNQIKIRGFRIETGEIENTLLRHEKIKEAFVTAYSNEDNDSYLCAYYTLNDKNNIGQELTSDTIIEFLLKELPAYMIPSSFVKLDKLPLNINGKIDNKALPLPSLKHVVEISSVKPANKIESKLIDIWAEVLRVDKEKIDIESNFFKLGGHSLKAMVLAAKLKKKFDVEIPIMQMFDTPILKKLAEYISDSKKDLYEGIPVAEIKEFYPISSAQKRFYVLNQMDKESISYNIYNTFIIEGNLDINRLEESLIKLINRHESLRTFFQIINNTIVQQIDEKSNFSIEYFEGKDKSAEDIIQEFIRPFDLSKSFLLRVGLIKLEENKYIFMIDMHHIISDGTSIAVFIKDFLNIYENKELPPLRIQYKDYAEWQNSVQYKENIKEQENYWVKQFEKDYEVIDIPYDYSRPAQYIFEGSSILFEIDFDITKSLKDIAAKGDATIFMILLSSFNILLSKLSNQEDIIVGTPTEGRIDAELSNLFGLFINTLALRNFPKAEISYLDFLKELKENTLLAFENQSYQFEDLVDRIEVKRNLGRNPIFDVMFVLHNMESPEIKIKDIKISPQKISTTISKFDLTLICVELDGKILCEFEYCNKLFKEETIKRFIEYFKKILESIVKNPQEKIYKLNILPEVEKNKVLLDFNKYQADSSKYKTIHSMFEAQVRENSDSIALVYEDKQLTYRELNEKANQLAHILRNKGIHNDIVVGLFVERSIEMIIGILGILKVGGAYLPIDTEGPINRIMHQLNECNVSIILATTESIKKQVVVQWSNLESSSKEQDIIKQEVILIDEINVHGLEEYNENLENINHENDLAYIIYTSGSTSKPKGVMIEHNSVTNLVTNLNYSFYQNYNDKLNISLISPYTFDASVMQIFASLLLGNTLYIIPESIRFDGRKLFDYYLNNKIDCMENTPVHLQLLLENEKKDLQNLNLKLIFVGGDKLPIKLVERFFECFEDDRTDLINIYGPTECCVDVSFCIVSRDNILPKGNIPIGKPMTNVKTYILDEYNNIQPIGVIGELCVSGPGLARGYIEEDKLTEEKFILNPYLNNQRMYKTGDLARWLANGDIELLGRSDYQVKIRGFRIGLTEIEKQIMQNEKIENAIVSDKEDENNNKYLCAYIVLKEGNNNHITINEIKDDLSLELPYYMIPSYFMFIDKIEFTTNGKIDRKRLPEPEIDRSKLKQTYVAPKTNMEIEITNLWKAVLKVEKVSINDNFFDLGGNSLLIIQMANKLKGVLNKEIAISLLFTYPTINSLVKHLEAEDAENKTEEINRAESIQKGKNRMRQSYARRKGNRDNE